MELLDFIFRLGVVFAIYGFLWGLIEIGIRILTAKRVRTIIEIYLVKGAKYVLLAAVTFRFCLEGTAVNLDYTTQIVLAGIILLTYFIGKLQNNQNKKKMFQMVGTMMPKTGLLNFNMQAEIVVIALSLMVFTGLHFNPNLAQNALSNWFYLSIIDIEDTVFFGFIFKVIGFFFLLSMLAKMVSGVSFIMNGGKSPKGPEDPFNNNQNNNDDGGFDSYEEIT